jgi:hypothetical protein
MVSLLMNDIFETFDSPSPLAGVEEFGDGVPEFRFAPLRALVRRTLRVLLARSRGIVHRHRFVTR